MIVCDKAIDDFGDKCLNALVTRCARDGQPILHKAALRGHHEVVEVIARYYVHMWGRKLDTVRDQVGKYISWCPLTCYSTSALQYNTLWEMVS